MLTTICLVGALLGTPLPQFDPNAEVLRLRAQVEDVLAQLKATEDRNLQYRRAIRDYQEELKVKEETIGRLWKALEKRR